MTTETATVETPTRESVKFETDPSALELPGYLAGSHEAAAIMKVLPLMTDHYAIIAAIETSNDNAQIEAVQSAIRWVDQFRDFYHPFTSEESKEACYEVILSCLNHTEATSWSFYSLRGLMSHEMTERMFDDPKLNEQALVNLWDDYRMRDIDARKRIMSHPKAGQRIAEKALDASQITLARQAASKLTFSEEVIGKNLENSDVQIRKHMAKQENITEDQLRVLACDSSEDVVKAAKRAMKRRGFAESDDLDEAIGDGVSAYFLANSDDPAVLKRMAASVDLDQQVLEMLGDASDEVAAAAASNPNASVEFLDKMVDRYQENPNHKLGMALASNPNMNKDMLLRFAESRLYFWGSSSHELTGLIAKNPNADAEILDEVGRKAHSAKAKKDVLSNPKLQEETIAYLARWESRKTVLVAVVEHENTSLDTLKSVATGYRGGKHKAVVQPAVERLAAAGIEIETPWLED